MGLPVESNWVRDIVEDAVSVEKRELTIGGTLGSRTLATTTADTDAVDDVTLLGLVTKTAGLVRARRARSAVDDVQLTELY